MKDSIKGCVKSVAFSLKLLLPAGLLIPLLVLVLSLPLGAVARAETGRVVVIGVDGLYPAGIEAANTPVMDGICETGACSFEARSVLPSKSSLNWASMLTVRRRSNTV